MKHLKILMCSFASFSFSSTHLSGEVWGEWPSFGQELDRRVGPHFQSCPGTGGLSDSRAVFPLGVSAICLPSFLQEFPPWWPCHCPIHLLGSWVPPLPNGMTLVFSAFLFLVALMTIVLIFFLRRVFTMNKYEKITALRSIGYMTHVP